jgi:hypothetical protein
LWQWCFFCFFGHYHSCSVLFFCWLICWEVFVNFSFDRGATVRFCPCCLFVALVLFCLYFAWVPLF